MYDYSIQIKFSCINETNHSCFGVLFFCFCFWLLHNLQVVHESGPPTAELTTAPLYQA